MAVAYLAIFILGACSGAIHPACYAYIGALLPLFSAFVYLNTASIIRSFGAATALNGFIFVLFLIAGEADIAYIIGTIVLPALAKGLGALEINVVKIAVIDDVTTAEHGAEAFQKPALAEFILVQALQRLEVVVLFRIFRMPVHRPGPAVQASYTKRHTGRSSPYSGVCRLFSSLKGTI